MVFANRTLMHYKVINWCMLIINVRDQYKTSFWLEILLLISESVIMKYGKAKNFANDLIYLRFEIQTYSPLH